MDAVLDGIKKKIKLALAAELPDCYAHFMRHHGDALAEDPLTEKGWVEGLGNLNFLIGTTQSFRSMFPDFPREYVVIGYAGTKLIEDVHERIDVYLMLNTLDCSIASIDSLGEWQVTYNHFLDWLAMRLIEALLHLDHESNLFVVAFDDKDDAVHLQKTLKELQHQELLQLDDSVLVNRDTHGHLHIHHSHLASLTGAAAGGAGGLVIGALLVHPLLGAALGIVSGVTSLGAVETLRHVGIEDEFVHELASLLAPGNWSLFALAKGMYREEVKERIRDCGGNLLMATIGGKDKAALQRVLDDRKVAQIPLQSA